MADKSSPADALAMLREPYEPRWRVVLDRLIGWLGNHGLARPGTVIVVALGVVAVVVGAVIWMFGVGSAGQGRSSRAALASATTAIPMASTTTTEATLAVHAAGAVALPGLYHVPGSARVADLVDAAGGFTGDADLDRVNLAAPLSDGARVFIPFIGDDQIPAVAADTGGQAVGGGSSSSEPSTTQPLDLNKATAEQLEELPGVGPATAAAIVDHRDQHGPFRSVDSLLDVRGIGPAKLEAIRKLVRV